MPKIPFDEDQLRHAIRKMTCRHRIYQVIKQELQRLGHWKNIASGKPFKSGDDRIKCPKGAVFSAKKRRSLRELQDYASSEEEYDFDPTAESDS